jgi:GNAT superfamily N-acetyltransferase
MASPLGPEELEELANQDERASCVDAGAHPGPSDSEAVTDVSIRTRHATDLPLCIEALAEVHESDRYPIVWPKDPALWLSPPGLLEGWIAERSGVIVGHVVLVDGGDAPDGLQSHGQPLATIKRLFVTPPARRQGTGARLLAHAHTWAIRSGLSLTLDVVGPGSSAAIALYERAGWQQTSTAIADWTTPEGDPVTVRYYRPPRSTSPP